MRQNSIFWGLMLVLAGLLFLLETMGIINVNVWGILWPVFLITLGVSFLSGYFFRKEQGMEKANVPVDGAARARIAVRHGAGRLQVSSGAPVGDLAEGEFGGGLDLKTNRRGDLLDVTMSVPVQVFPFNFGPGFTLDWNLRLNRDLPISLDFETGANESRLDLTDLKVSNLRVQSGASSTEIQMPANAGATHAEVSSGAASMRILIPSNVGARIKAEGGLASIHIDTLRFPKFGDTYQSQDYATAENRLDLTVETGVGSVEIR